MALTMAQQYQVLARKYRPKNFHELIGQDHVSQALINAIDYERLHHAYLFTGTRGVGKTTIARILSKCLNCDTGVTSTPCGVCNNCVAIDEGRFIDLIEIDAASRTKVEDTRELLDNVPYAPTQGRYKVYLIDEVHMLSTHSFNALLKTLEEPPEHVKFLLATTDPQKLPITIISRCLQFVLRPLPQSLLSEHLANILTQESVAYSQPALWQLANAAKGSVRDALSLTDQAIAFGQGQLTDETVNNMLGLINTTDLVDLLAQIHDNDRSAVAVQIEQMRLKMVDASSMFDGLAELLHQMALVQLLPEVALGLNETQEHAITQLANRISPEVLQLYYEIVIQAREGIRLANTPMQSLEMCLLRLLAFRPLGDNEVTVATPNNEVESGTQSEITHDTDVELASANEDAITPHDASSLPSDAKVAEISEDPQPQASIVETEQGNSMAEDRYSATVVQSLPVEMQEDSAPLENLTSEHQVMASEGSEVVADKVDGEFELFANEETLSQQVYDTQMPVSNAEPNAEPNVSDSHSINVETTEQPQRLTNTLDESIRVNNPLSQESQHSGVETQDQPQSLEVDDPRTLLKCPPQPLSGQWTVEKWDYWLQNAREQKQLHEDELALARQGLMTGECDGSATFITTVNSPHLQATFTHLVSKIQQQFPNSQVELQVSQDLNQQGSASTPEVRQQQRLNEATTAATNKLMKSPVMQYLSSQGQGRMGKVKILNI